MFCAIRSCLLICTIFYSWLRNWFSNKIIIFVRVYRRNKRSSLGSNDKPEKEETKFLYQNENNIENGQEQSKSSEFQISQSSSNDIVDISSSASKELTNSTIQFSEINTIIGGNIAVKYK